MIRSATLGRVRRAAQTCLALALATFTVKSLLVFGGFGVVLYGLYAIAPKIEALFARIRPPGLEVPAAVP